MTAEIYSCISLSHGATSNFHEPAICTNLNLVQCTMWQKMQLKWLVTHHLNALHPYGRLFVPLVYKYCRYKATNIGTDRAWLRRWQHSSVSNLRWSETQIQQQERSVATAIKKMKNTMTCRWPPGYMVLNVCVRAHPLHWLASIVWHTRTTATIKKENALNLT